MILAFHKLLILVTGGILHCNPGIWNSKRLIFHKFQKLTNNTKINRLQKFPGLQYSVTAAKCWYLPWQRTHRLDQTIPAGEATTGQTFLDVYSWHTALEGTKDTHTKKKKNGHDR